MGLTGFFYNVVYVISNKVVHSNRGCLLPLSHPSILTIHSLLDTLHATNRRTRSCSCGSSISRTHAGCQGSDNHTTNGTLHGTTGYTLGHRCTYNEEKERKRKKTNGIMLERRKGRPCSVPLPIHSFIPVHSRLFFGSFHFDLRLSRLSFRSSRPMMLVLLLLLLSFLLSFFLFLVL